MDYILIRIIDNENGKRIIESGVCQYDEEELDNLSVCVSKTNMDKHYDENELCIALEITHDNRHRR